jgi:tetratricopeptide (TPR) repeat protein
LLQEAKEKYPRDPQVNLVAYFTVPYDNQQPPSPERQHLLEGFKESDPGNPLGNYLAARDYFKAGQTDKAVEELTAAAAKVGFRDYSADLIQNSEEVWRAAGYSEAEAKLVASAFLRIDPLVEVKRLAENLVALANAYQQTGDATSAQAVLRIGAVLGNQLDQPSAAGLVRNLAGLRVESQVLSALAPTTPYDDSGRTVADRITEIAQRREALLSLSEQGVKAQQTMGDSDLVSFYDRQKTFGSESALRWLISRQGMPTGEE